MSVLREKEDISKLVQDLPDTMRSQDCRNCLFQGLALRAPHLIVASRTPQRLRGWGLKPAAALPRYAAAVEPAAARLRARPCQRRRSLSGL